MLLTTFLPAVGRKHGVEAHASVAVKAHPVVGEQGVRGVGGRIIVHDNDVDAARPKVVDHAGKFGHCDIVNVVHFGVLLVRVVACRLFVFSE